MSNTSKEIAEEQEVTSYKQDTDKDVAKKQLEKKMKMLGIVGVVYDEKNGLVIGVEENGNPKIINQDDAFVISKNLNIIGGSRNNYALGDTNQNKEDAPQLDSSKVNEAKDEGEKVKKSEETKQRIEKDKKRLEELKKEPNAMEKALQKVLGRNSNNLKKEILSGKTSPEIKDICSKLAARAASNIAKGAQKITKQISKSIGGRP